MTRTETEKIHQAIVACATRHGVHTSKVRVVVKPSGLVVARLVEGRDS